MRLKFERESRYFMSGSNNGFVAQNDIIFKNYSFKTYRNNKRFTKTLVQGQKLRKSIFAKKGKNVY